MYTLVPEAFQATGNFFCIYNIYQTINSYTASLMLDQCLWIFHLTFHRYFKLFMPEVSFWPDLIVHEILPYSQLFSILTKRILDHMKPTSNRNISNCLD